MDRRFIKEKKMVNGRKNKALSCLRNLLVLLVSFFSIEGAELAETTRSVTEQKALDQGIWLVEKIILEANEKELTSLAALSKKVPSSLLKSLYGHVLLYRKESGDAMEGIELIETTLGPLMEKAKGPGEERGDPYAQLSVGLSFLWGHGVESDREAARHWLNPLRERFTIAKALLQADQWDTTPAFEKVFPVRRGLNDEGRAKEDEEAKACEDVLSSPRDTGDNVGISSLRNALIENDLPFLEGQEGESLKKLLRTEITVSVFNGGQYLERYLQAIENRGGGRAIVQGAGDKTDKVYKVPPLAGSILMGKMAFAKALLEKGAAVNQPRAKDGWTALMFASMKGDQEACRLLLKHGASLEVSSTRKHLRFSAGSSPLTVEKNDVIRELLINER